MQSNGSSYRFDRVVVTGTSADDATDKLNEYVVKGIHSSGFLYTVAKVKGKWCGCRYVRM